MATRKTFMLWLVAAWVALSFAANAQERDPVFIDYGPRGTAPSQLATGVVMGSIGFAPPSPGLTALSVHLVPLDPGGHKIELFAAYRSSHPSWRTPDIDTGEARLWAFAGAIPEGRYVIHIAGASGADPREILWIELNPSFELEVKAGEGIYIGRWQFTLPGVEVPQPMVRVPGQPLVIRDTLAQDKALLQKRGRQLPEDIVDAPRSLLGPRT